MDRRQLRDILDELAAAEAPHIAAMEPHRKALEPIKHARDMLYEAFGQGEPVATCETCGLPFFEGDDYVTSEDGVSICWKRGVENPAPGAVCFDPS